VTAECREVVFDVRADHDCEEAEMKWETPEYTVVEVCAEATGYFYRA
jgi:hypothetical protein